MKKLCFLTLMMLVMMGCATAPQKEQISKALFFPPLPEEPRLQFLASFSSSKDIEKKSSGFAQFIIGKEITEKPIIKPYGVRARNGKIFVCDTVYNGIEILNLKERTFQYFRPKGRIRLNNPINLDVQPNGDMYIADPRSGQVLIFNDQGDYISSIGAKGELKPTDVVIKNDKVYVCDLKSHSVKVYNLTGNNFLFAIPSDQSAKEGQLFSPTNIDVDDQGHVYVSDTGSFNVKKFDAQGNLLKVIGAIGDAPGNFARPKGLAVDRRGFLYVVDAAFNNVQIFDPQGKLLLYFPEPEDDVQFVLPAGISIDYDHVGYFQSMIDKDFEVEYLVFVASQYGERKINVFGFGKKKRL